MEPNGATVIDMSDLVTRKKVVVLTAIHSLRLETKGIRTHRGASTIQIMRDSWGFKSRTKTKLLEELSEWLEGETADDPIPWIPANWTRKL